MLSVLQRRQRCSSARCRKKVTCFVVLTVKRRAQKKTAAPEGGHTYLATYTHTYIHNCIHTYIYTYAHTYKPTYLHTYMTT